MSEQALVDPAIDPDIIPPENRIRVDDLIETDDDEPETIPQITLSDEDRNNFRTLLTVGRRTRLVTVMNDHAVRIRTLKNGDEMRVGLYTKPYLGSQGFARAYQVGICAAGIVEIDGVPLYNSLRQNPSKQEVFDKSTEILEEYSPPVVAAIYDEIFKLEQEFPELMEQLGKRPG